jgi:hypothetical protein
VEGFDLMTQVRAIYNVNKEVVGDLKDTEIELITQVEIEHDSYWGRIFKLKNFDVRRERIGSIQLKEAVVVEPFELSEQNIKRITYFKEIEIENERQIEIALKYDKLEQIREKNLRIALKNLQSISVGLGFLHSHYVIPLEDQKNEISEVVKEISDKLRVLDKKFYARVNIK